MKRLWRNHHDLIIASALFLSSSALAAYAYAAIGEMERPRGFLVSSIRPGNAAFFALSRGNCVGRLETTLDEREKIVQFVAAGSAKGRYMGGETATAFRLEMYFNPLGQMSEGDLRIESGQLDARFGTTGVNPINVTYTAKITGRELSGSIALPGPVMVRRERDGSYHIESDHLAAKSLPHLPLSYAGLAKTLSLEVFDGSSGAPAACADGLKAIELGPLIDAFGPLVSALGRNAMQERSE